MRGLAILGIVLIVIGIAAFGFQGVTYFTRERVVDAGPVKIDADRPHTIIFNPVGAGVAVVAGLALVVVGTQRKSL
jgi:hypothetical protein